MLWISGSGIRGKILYGMKKGQPEPTLQNIFFIYMKSKMQPMISTKRHCV